MLCDNCHKKEATVYLTEITNGNKTELHLCEDCASETGKMYFDTDFSFQNLLSGLLDINFKNITKSKQNNVTLTCPKCKMNYETFMKIGKFGCSDCYKTFEQFLPPIFKRIHGNDTHTGKIPKTTKGEILVKRRVDSLKAKLNEAISKEEYETAAKLRDEIRSLTKGDANNA